MAFAGSGTVKTTTSQGDALTGPLQISTFEWQGDGTTAPGDTCTIVDGNGDLVWTSSADGAYFKDIHAHFNWVRDLTIQTLDSGRITVYIV